jgi:aminoglycoside 3-N-acetyltransferase
LSLKALKNHVRAGLRKARQYYVDQFKSFGPAELLAALRATGISSGDTLMVHAAFEPHHGFRGTTTDFVDTLEEAVGTTGTIVMPSMPYTGSTFEYLSKHKVFDVRKTPSHMGLVSEFFRRRPGVVRSLNAAHPVLAKGPKADWLIADHEKCQFSCGPGSPFEKLLAADGKVLLFNVGLSFLTFFHYLESVVMDRTGMHLYRQPPFNAVVVDSRGVERQLLTYAFSSNAVRMRDPARLPRWLDEDDHLRRLRLGASSLITLELRKVLATVELRAEAGQFFYNRPASSSN